MPKKSRGLALSKSNGFTLIELLVVISIITILSTVGLVSFQNVRAKALEAQRVGNIDAIKKAYEIKFDPSANGGQGGYRDIVDNDFANKKIPTPDGTNATSYIIKTTNTDQTLSNFAACVNKNDGSVCYAQSSACYCKTSNQGAPMALLQNNATTCDPSGNLLNGLVGYWKMDEPPGSAVAADYIGNSPGTYNGSTTTAGQSGFGNAGLFNGSNNFGSINNTSSLGAVKGPFTMSLWVYPTSSLSNNPGLLSKGGWNSGFDWLTSTGAFDFRSSCLTSGTDNYFFVTSPPLNTWSFIAITYDPAGGSNNMTMYLKNSSGSYSGVNTGSGYICMNSTALNIAYPGGAFFPGEIDDFRIYKRSLSSTEVSTLYNNGNGCIP